MSEEERARELLNRDKWQVNELYSDALAALSASYAAVRAEEREACAKVADDMDSFEGDAIAAVIRARGRQSSKG